MARIRTIKPEIWQDEDLAAVSETAMLLAIGLLNHADDEGYFKAHPALVRAAVFPLREPSVSIQCALTELSDARFIELFEGSDGKSYGFVRTFADHQRVNRPSPSKIKGLRAFTEDSVSDHGALTAGKEGKGTGKGKEGEGSACVHAPPPPDPNETGERPRLSTFAEGMGLAQEVIAEFARAFEGTVAVVPKTPTTGLIQSLALRCADLRREGLEPDLAYWRRLFAHLSGSDFLAGRRTQANGQPFRLRLDWLLREEEFAKARSHAYCDAGVCPHVHVPTGNGVPA
jgi:hypothetical protein